VEVEGPEDGRGCVLLHGGCWRPLYTRPDDVDEAMERLRALVAAGGHEGVDATPARVT
jgi:hypothetical protein